MLKASPMFLLSTFLIGDDITYIWRSHNQAQGNFQMQHPAALKNEIKDSIYLVHISNSQNNYSFLCNCNHDWMKMKKCGGN